MAWARIDDGFDDHPKILALLEEEQGAAAVGLWTLCLTWAHRNTRKKGKTPGLIPSGLPRRYLGPAGRELAKLLVVHGLWDEDDAGWTIHDFADYLPTEETKAARSAAGKRGAEKRWAAKRQAEAEAQIATSKQDDGKLPSGSHDGGSNDVASGGSRTPARRAIPKGIAPEPGPEQPPLPSEAGADKPRTTGESDSTKRKRPRASSNNAGDVIAAYVDGAREAGLPLPAEKLRARVGKEARELLSKDSELLPSLVSAARSMGAAGWHDLAVQLQRDAANAKKTAGADPPRGSNFAANSGARARTFTAEEIENMDLEGRV